MEAWLCVHSIFKLQSGLGDMTVFNLRWQKYVCGPRSANVVVGVVCAAVENGAAM